MCLCIPLFWLISIARYKYLLSRDKIWNLPWTCCLLAFHIVMPGLTVWLEHFASSMLQLILITDIRFAYVFPQRHRSFTSRKLYVSQKTFFGFLQLSDRAYVSRAWCIGLFPLLVVLAPHDSNAAIYEQVCWLFTLVPEVFLDVSPHERAAKELRSFAASLRAGSPLSHTRERR